MQRHQFSSFDLTVFTALAIALALLLVVVVRGDQVGGAQVSQSPGAAGETSLASAAEGAAADVFAPPSGDLYYLIVDDGGMAQIEMTRLNQPDDAPNPPQQVTDEALGVWDFTVAPHTGAVVYSQLKAGGNADLWQVTPGEEATLLLACEDAACNTPAFSSDGALLAYSRHNETGSGATIMSPPRIWLLDTATGETAPLLQDSQFLGSSPAFSPDSAWLAFVSPDNLGTTLVRLQDGEQRIYASGTGEIGAWSPTSDAFLLTQVLTTTDAYPTHLLHVNMAEGSTTDMSDLSRGAEAAEVSDDSPAYSPDGAWIAFRRKFLSGEKETPGKQIWVMRSDGSDARALTDDAGFDNAAPRWSSDGTTLLFHRFNLRNAPIVLRIMAARPFDGILWEVVNPGQDPQWRD